MKEHTIYISKPIEYWVLEILVVKSHTVAIFFYVAKNGFSHLLVSSSPLAWRLILITCNEQIEVRLQNMKKAHYKPPPIQWSNIEYVMPMSILFVLVFIISITVNFLYCCRRQENSGPRRNNNFELVNTN